MTEEATHKDYSLSFTNHYKHFLLLHDFLFKITKTKATNSDFFDLQIEVFNGMKKAVDRGSKIFQFVTFSSLVLYFLRGNNIKMKFFSGMLYTYWYNHVMTLGSYAGAFMKIPSVYNKTVKYYEQHPQQKNLVADLTDLMQKHETVEQPQVYLTELFSDKLEEKPFVSNDYFIKNRQKYFSNDILENHFEQTKKLKYFDSFLTRYIYYSFQRWCIRFGQLLSLQQEGIQ